MHPHSKKVREYLFNQSISFFTNFYIGQINLANVGCINHLRVMLLNADTEKTKCKIFLALHNLALNNFAITQFSV